MMKTLSAAAAVLLAMSAVQASAREGTPIIVQQGGGYPEARVVDIRKESVPIVRGKATELVVNDVRTSRKLVRRPVETIVYVSTDPYDHVH
jgi:hypothetical protein